MHNDCVVSTSYAWENTMLTFSSHYAVMIPPIESILNPQYLYRKSIEIFLENYGLDYLNIAILSPYN